MQNLELQNNDDSILNFEQYQGSDYLLLIFFRGAWCNLCKRQLVEVNSLINEFTSSNIKPLAISPDTKFKSSLLKTFLRLKFPILSDTEFSVIDYFKLKTKFKDHITSKPAVILISPDHQVIFEKIGKEYDDTMSGKNILNNCQKIIKSNV
ncbi:redoxin domain-containing protein [Candidatus Falkowbacteria bacterium]|jgi:peroxiredoxin|nr:redoxin domain-containing protein [Candidatus Falkowbacteria bacterium]MBT5502716.1 redoxin domain-containing protein [Candidatus Falkowbacteria bacterium]MBT6573500.1 redoxin domain-containing protein [Candidatus Falkowbacteria bacterium]MBT7348050.1 redoxin domain-containing protein [Candidatus Falkowbacteria bacterium]MBT7501115.1 redoxin domain-containing protein [Candidatus Falkowbacteria bacterium]